MEKTESFDYSNYMTRPRSQFIRIASILLPGVRKVQSEIAPYADAWKKVNQQTLRSTGPLWVVIGDSMSQGVGAASYDTGWVGQLARTFEEEGTTYRILNLSVSGARVEDVLATQLPALTALNVTPDLVTVLIGANNIIRSKYRLNLSKDMKELLEKLPKGAIVGSITGPSPQAAQANQLLLEAEKRGEITIAHMGTAVKPPLRGKLAEDFFHPNEHGYAGIARVFKAAIDQA